jgi:hypothetical protein
MAYAGWVMTMTRPVVALLAIATIAPGSSSNATT